MPEHNALELCGKVPLEPLAGSVGPRLLGYLETDCSPSAVKCP